MAKGYKTGGRKKGTPNKITTALKDAISNAFEEVGGKDYLVKVAKDDPKTFCTLLGKVIPLQLGSDPESDVVTRIEIVSGVPRSDEWLDCELASNGAPH